jgi:hypothetical protein
MPEDECAIHGMKQLLIYRLLDPEHSRVNGMLTASINPRLFFQANRFKLFRDREKQDHRKNGLGY